MLIGILNVLILNKLRRMLLKFTSQETLLLEALVNQLLLLKRL